MLGNSYSKESKLASAALLGYLERTQMTGLERITKIIPFAESEYMSLDFSAKRNLELTETLHEKSVMVRFCGFLISAKPLWVNDF